MLVLSRKDGEGIHIGDEIVITVLSTSGGQVRLGIEAPNRVTIHREEIYDMIAGANRQAIAAPLPTLPPTPPPTPAETLSPTQETPE